MISLSSNSDGIKQIKFAPILPWLDQLPDRPPYDIAFYSLCSKKGLIVSKGERVTAGKIFSPNKRFSIDFSSSYAQIYDEVGGFVANAGGFFQVKGIEITADGEVLLLSGNTLVINHSAFFLV